MSADHTPLRIEETTPAYWEVTLDNPPMNVWDIALMKALTDLLDRIEASEELKVVVFDSADPDYFVSHFDMTGESTEYVRSVGPSGLTRNHDIMTRLAESSVVSISKLRGRARGVGSEFLLSTDLRFASREKAVLGQPEVGAGVVPGAGGIQRLVPLVGRHRALEVVLSADDFDADTAALYGWINRAVPDAELDTFVDSFARRIASFDQKPLAESKAMVNRATLPEPDEMMRSQKIFAELLTTPETQSRVTRAFERGMQQRGDFELHFGSRITELGED